MLDFFKSRSKKAVSKNNGSKGFSEVTVSGRAASGRNSAGNVPQATAEPEPEIAFPQDLPKGVTLEDFDLLKVLGKGGFGKVMLVRKKNTTDIYAMKVLRKEAVIRRNQVQHTKTETHILKQIRHPFLTRMHYGTPRPPRAQVHNPLPPPLFSVPALSSLAALHRVMTRGRQALVSPCAALCVWGARQPSKTKTSSTWSSTTYRAASSSTG